MRLNTISVFLLDGVAKVFVAGSTLLLIRVLPVPEYATLTIALAATSLIVQTTATNINLIYILAAQREMARSDRGALLGLQVCAAAILCLLALVPFSLDSTVVAAGTFLGVAVVASDFVRTEFQRKLLFRGYAGVELSRTGLFLFFLLILVSIGTGRLNSADALGTQALATALVTVPLIFRLNLGQGIASVARGITLAKSLFGAPYRDLFFYFLALALFSQLGIFMLKWLGTTHSLAAYGSGFRYYSFLLVALGAAQAVLLPMIARTRAKTELTDIYRKHRTLLFLFVPIVLIAAIAAPIFMPWIDGGRYPEAIPIFWVLATSAIISFASSPYAFVTLRFMKFQFLLMLVLAAIGINALLNMVLIPIYGGMGAAIATLVSYGVLNGFTFYKSYRLLKNPNEELKELSPLISAAMR